MQKLGKQTIKFDNPPTILQTACIVGPKESEGPLAKYFDQCLDDELWGEKTWEKAESKIIKETVNTCISKSSIPADKIEYCFAGDLLNQCISSSFGLRELNIPFFGIFGACSTFVEGLSLASVFVENGINYAICAASSHFCSSEKQFRFPLELGNQRPPSSQWTVTGAGSAIVAKNGDGPYITHITSGKIIDMGIKDANNMGAAMAPAAFDTLMTHFQDTGRSPNYYDAIITGDLGHIGKDILTDLCSNSGYNIKSVYNDCGVLIFDKEKQDTHSGGSGCGCCASVFSGYFFKQFQEKKIKRLLLIATGALMNATSSQQGESIPGIAHAISIEI
ncbi:MAG: stage V sporulation protein AD [Clostridia bacterium]|nr:stage V sporulation protein AD [Clostridia bacterium]